jgi:two-component system chemotaxis sensor kinase CheA
MNEFLQQFIIESRELCEQAGSGLLTLEKTPEDAGERDAVFRALHTLKGGAGIVEFTAMERTLHVAEDLLAAARAERIRLDRELVGHLLAVLDQVLQWLAGIEQAGELPPPSSNDEAERIIARLRGAAVPEPKPGLTGAEPAAPDIALLAAQLALLRSPAAAASPAHCASALHTAVNVLRASGRASEAGQLELLASDRGAMAAELERLLAGATSFRPAAASASPASHNEGVTHILRVEAQRIDALVRLTGELTIARNALAHLARQAASDASPLAPALHARDATFARLIGDLQQAVLALRVLPLRTVFQRFPRLLREMAGKSGKAVVLRVAGEDTEADKAIVEMLFEPLLHIIRNAVDHGIETIGERAAAGKPREGTVSLRALRQGDQVLVEVADDGAGMDLQRIRQVAAQRGVASPEGLAAMTDADLAALVFTPGFSTSTQVTALSGRGVGMDAVRTAVERFGGRIGIQSQRGAGTTVRFTLPFSVMMTTVMSVEAGGQVFGVPLDAVIETIRVPRSAINEVGAARAVVIREQTLPVIGLGRLLGGAGQTGEAGEATLVIATFGGQQCGLEVDALGERMEIILKPLEGLLAGTPGIVGTTVLGDGRVLLVLDVGELLQ